MVIAVAADKAIDSASDSDGLINQAFKLTVLIGLALAVGVGLFLIWKLTSIFADLTTAIEPILGGASSTIGFIGTVATFVVSTLPLGSRSGLLKRIIN